MKRYDIIISGGGMVGSVAAAAAVAAGFSVILIEAGPSKALNEEMDLRVSAVSFKNMKLLAELDIKKYLNLNRTFNFSHMQVWDNSTSQKSQIDFSADFAHQDLLGCMMENNNLIQSAWRKLKECSDCLLLESNTICSIDNDEKQIRVTLDSGEVYKGRLLIGAEGRNSFVREHAQINTQRKSYAQHGVVCYISLSNAPDSTALQAFNNGGPIGILPFGNGLFSIVWSVPDDQYEHWLECDEKDFIAGVKQAIGQDFGDVCLISKRAAFPLQRSDAEAYFFQRMVLCGDSAHGIHPLAGQGVNLGLGDVSELFSSLDLEILKDNDLLQLHLRKYQRRRLSQVSETSTMMSFLHHLFVDDAYFKKPLRALGLQFLNQLPLKKWLLKQAGS